MVPEFRDASMMRPPDSRVEHRNSTHLVMDIAWFGFASAASLRFLPYFAIRLGATPLEVGLITSLPALVLFIVNWLSGWWQRRYDNSLSAMLLPTILHRAVFLLPVFAPFFPANLRPIWIVLAVTIPAVGQGVSSTVFIVLMREAVKKEQLALLMARRKFWMSVAIGIGTLLAGLLLESFPFPLNYQVVFCVAAGGSLFSLWHLTRVKVAVHEPLPIVPLARVIAEQVASPSTRSVIYVTLTAFISFYFIVGVIPVHLEALGATEGFIAIFGVVELLAAAASTIMTTRLVRLLGNRRLAAAAVMVTALAGVILGLTSNLWIALTASVFTGAGWTLADIAIFGFFADHTDTQNTGATMLYNAMMYVGISIGPLLGNSLLQVGMSTASVLLLGAGLRIMGGILMQTGYPKWKRVQSVPTQS